MNVLAINLKTAEALGLARADEVIETRRREFITVLGGRCAR